MIGQTSHDRRGTLNPTVTITTNGQLETQAMMRIAEVVKAANYIHTGFQGLGFVYQGSGAPCQIIETLTKSGIEAFDESGVNDALALSFADQAVDHVFTALHNPAGDVQLVFLTVFDDLNDSDIGPGKQPGAARFVTPVWHCGSK